MILRFADLRGAGSRTRTDGSMHPPDGELRGLPLLRHCTHTYQGPGRGAANLARAVFASWPDNKTIGRRRDISTRRRPSIAPAVDRKRCNGSVTDIARHGARSVLAPSSGAGILLKWVTARFIWNKLHKNMPRIDHFFHD